MHYRFTVTGLTAFRSTFFTISPFYGSLVFDYFNDNEGVGGSSPPPAGSGRVAQLVEYLSSTHFYPFFFI